MSRCVYVISQPFFNLQRKCVRVCVSRKETRVSRKLTCALTMGLLCTLPPICLVFTLHVTKGTKNVGWSVCRTEKENVKLFYLKLNKVLSEPGNHNKITNDEGTHSWAQEV